MKRDRKNDGLRDGVKNLPTLVRVSAQYYRKIGRDPSKGSNNRFNAEPWDKKPNVSTVEIPVRYNQL